MISTVVSLRLSRPDLPPKGGSHRSQLWRAEMAVIGASDGATQVAATAHRRVDALTVKASNGTIALAAIHVSANDSAPCGNTATFTVA
jgi:hypothetical protein